MCLPKSTLRCVFQLGKASYIVPFFLFQAEDGIRDFPVTGVQTCALPITTAKAVPSTDSARMLRYSVWRNVMVSGSPMPGGFAGYFRNGSRAADEHAAPARNAPRCSNVLPGSQRCVAWNTAPNNSDHVNP